VRRFSVHISLGVLLALSATLAACGSSSSSTSTCAKGRKASDDWDLAIAFSGDFSDPGKGRHGRGYKPLGVGGSTRTAESQGHPVKLKIVDDALEPEPGGDQLPEPDHAGQGGPGVRPLLHPPHRSGGLRRPPLRLRVRSSRPAAVPRCSRSISTNVFFVQPAPTLNCGDPVRRLRQVRCPAAQRPQDGRPTRRSTTPFSSPIADRMQKAFEAMGIKDRVQDDLSPLRRPT